VSWLLDADVLSQPAKKNGHAGVIAWLEREKDSCYTSAIVIAQLAYWVRNKRGKQREALQAWLTRLIDALPHSYPRRVLASDGWEWTERRLNMPPARVTAALPVLDLPQPSTPVSGRSSPLATSWYVGTPRESPSDVYRDLTALLNTRGVPHEVPASRHRYAVAAGARHLP